MFDDVKIWHRHLRLENLAATMAKLGYQVQVHDSAEAINAAVLALVQAGDSVGIGGSVTVRELGLDAALRAKASQVHDHWQPGLDAAGVAATVRHHPASDVFVSSSNALTMKGELVNIDGTGNRVASMIYGPKRVVAVIGWNKLAEDLDQAMARIKQVACPLNSKRKSMGKACEKAGRCVDCRDPASMCMVTSVIAHRPPAIDYHVILTPLELGF
jgi:hypothetical protein